MCPAFEDRIDTFDDLEMDGESVRFDLNIDECPAPQANLLPSLLEPRQCDVPRSTDLAAKFAVSDNANSPKTTIMVRNIPSRYTQSELVSELEDMGFAGSFDFAYLPMDRSTRCTLGYAFVNFVSAFWADKCMNSLQDYRFKKYQKFSNKIALVSLAHIQGLEANLAYYEDKFVSSCKRKKGRPLVVVNTLDIPTFG
jgi:hypothetical protein